MLVSAIRVGQYHVWYMYFMLEHYHVFFEAAVAIKTTRGRFKMMNEVYLDDFLLVP